MGRRASPLVDPSSPCGRRPGPGGSVSLGARGIAPVSAVRAGDGGGAGLAAGDARGEGTALVAGMTICIEPMVTFGSGEVAHIEDDPWTLVSADDTLAAHWEHTVAITDEGPLILTAPPRG